MRFIGSKRLLLKNIEYVISQNILKHEKLNTFCDIFSGTTIVSQYFKNKYKIISNDLLYFSYCLQKSYIELNQKPNFKNLKISLEIEEYLNIDQSYVVYFHLDTLLFEDHRVPRNANELNRDSKNKKKRIHFHGVDMD